MKLNCDMGESFGTWTKGMDAEVMPYIDMASIACGFHASDPLTMDHTVKLALAQNVTIGAHPGSSTRSNPFLASVHRQVVPMGNQRHSASP